MEFRKYFGLSESQNMVYQNSRNANKQCQEGNLQRKKHIRNQKA